MVSENSQNKGEWGQSFEDYQEARSVTDRRHVQLWTVPKAIALFGVALLLFWYYAPKTCIMGVSCNTYIVFKIRRG